MPVARRLADLDEFEAAVAAFVGGDPVRNTIPLVALHTARLRPPTGPPADRPVFLLVEQNDGDGPSTVAAVALRTPPWPATLVLDPHATDRETVAQALAAALAEHVADTPGFSGPVADLDIVVPRWSMATGRAAVPRRHMLLHRLGPFTPVSAAAGRAEIAGPEDEELIDRLARWRSEFATAIDSPVPTPVDPDVVRRSIASGAVWMVWRDAEDQPVALAVGNAAVAGCARIAPVFTPPRFERRGFGTAVTSALAGHLLAAGAAAIVLFTDAANPTSNAIYRRLGFRPVEEFIELEVV